MKTRFLIPLFLILVMFMAACQPSEEEKLAEAQQVIAIATQQARATAQAEEENATSNSDSGSDEVHNVNWNAYGIYHVLLTGNAYYVAQDQVFTDCAKTPNGETTVKNVVIQVEVVRNGERVVEDQTFNVTFNCKAFRNWASEQNVDTSPSEPARPTNTPRAEAPTNDGGDQYTNTLGFGVGIIGEPGVRTADPGDPNCDPNQSCWTINPDIQNKLSDPVEETIDCDEDGFTMVTLARGDFYIDGVLVLSLPAEEDQGRLVLFKCLDEGFGDRNTQIILRNFDGSFGLETNLPNGERVSQVYILQNLDNIHVSENCGLSGCGTAEITMGLVTFRGLEG